MRPRSLMFFVDSRTTSRAARTFGAVLPLVALLAVATAGCDRAPPPDGLKDWTPADHDGEKKSAAANQGPKGASNGAPPLVELTWRNQCQSCHGPAGHGDGPQGPMVKAQDLSREEWQAKVSDAEIVAAITGGKGRMPKFELPEEVVRGLVSRVRSFRGR